MTIPIATRRALLGRQETYAEKVLSYSPVAYWPLWEATGTVAYCLTNSAMNGAYGRDVSTMGTITGMGDGNTAPNFNGAADFVNIYTAPFASSFSGALGAFMVWAKVSGAGIWEDGNNHYLASFLVDGSNYIIPGKPTTNNSMFYTYRAGGTSDTVSHACTDTAWFYYVINWNKAGDRTETFYNTASQGTRDTLGVWAGALSSTATCVGAGSTVPANAWSGGLAHAAWFDRVMTLPEIQDLYIV